MKEAGNFLSTKLRDSLAISRTMLANERTFLSYVRTGIYFILAGAGVLKFIEDGVYVFVGGWSLIVIGLTFFYFGKSRYEKLRQVLEKNT